MPEHWLAANKTTDIAHVVFMPDGQKVRVEGILGASRHVCETMTLENARNFYRELKSKGWVVPSKPMRYQRLKALMYGVRRIYVNKNVSFAGS